MEAWLQAALDRLGHESRPMRQLTRGRSGGLLAALSRERDAELDPDLAALIELVGLADDGSPREWKDMIDRGTELGLDPAALPHVIQAYVRAIGRIVAVESAVMRDALRAAAPEDRERLAAQIIDELLPMSLRGYHLLHRALLDDALTELAETGLDHLPGEDALVVGMADICRSTAYLRRCGTEGLELLVDAMFTAGQAATAPLPVHVVKYVGDGVFIAGADALAVADATADIVERLEAELPLRARGGVAAGLVVQRAGDVFGLPITFAQVLTKAARPGTVLLSEIVAGMVPAERRGRLRARELQTGQHRVATLRGALA
jgi:class 3 adenylate cyclase